MSFGERRSNTSSQMNFLSGGGWAQQSERSSKSSRDLTGPRGAVEVVPESGQGASWMSGKVFQASRRSQEQERGPSQLSKHCMQVTRAMRCPGQATQTRIKCSHPTTADTNVFYCCDNMLGHPEGTGSKLEDMFQPNVWTAGWPPIPQEYPHVGADIPV